MGFFDRLGAGGGKLAIHVGATRVVAGSTISGTIAFTGGKRAQSIKAIRATVHCNATVKRPGPNGLESHTESKTIVPQSTVSGPVVSQPGQALEFAFSFPLPAGLQSSAPGVTEYRISASADIDGEVDPGATTEFHVEGAPVATAYTAGASNAVPTFAPTTNPAPLTMGSAVLAQWQNGQWYPGRVVAVNGGMFGVDWDDPALGASTWVAAQQIRVAPPMAAMAKAGTPLGQVPKAGASLDAAPLAIGVHVLAQWQDGQWYPARIVAADNGLFGVDWDNPALGASSWLGPHQVAPG